MSKTYYIHNFNSQELKAKFEASGIHPITPKALNDEDLSPEDNLIVLCELDKDKDGNRVMRSEFYGIKLVQELRREKKFKGKVLFVSFMPEDYLVNKTPNGAIIGAYGHGFLRLPADTKEMKKAFKNINLLDDMALFDIMHHFSGIREIINERLHALRSQLESKQKIGKDEITLAENAILNAYAMAGKDPGQILEELKGLNDEELTGQELYKFLEEKIRSLFPAENRQAVDSSLKPTWKYWEVLWLDDDEPVDSLLKKEIENRGITVHRAKTYEEAMEIWNRDLATLQKISVVITDYRLKDEEGNSRKKQGYHFLKDLATHHPEIAYMAYSHLPRKFLIESFKQFGVPVELFSKIDYPVDKPEAINIIVDKVVQKGDEHWMMRNSQPNAKEWDNVKQAYFVFKNSPEFVVFERKLSKITRENLDILIKEFSNVDNIKDLWKIKFREKLVIIKKGIPKIEHLLKVRRFALGLYAFLLNNKELARRKGLDEKYFLDFVRVVLNNSSVSKSRGEKLTLDEKIKQLIEKLLPDQLDKFIKVLRENKKVQEECAIKVSGLKQILGVHSLKLATNGFTDLLPEEYIWLQYDSGLKFPIHQEMEIYWHKIMELRQVIKTEFTKSNFFKSIINDSKEIQYQNEKIVFASNYEPLIRSVRDVKIILDYIYNKLNPQDENYSKNLKAYINLLIKIRRKIRNKIDIETAIMNDKNLSYSINNDLNSLIYFVDKMPFKNPEIKKINEDINEKIIIPIIKEWKKERRENIKKALETNSSNETGGENVQKEYEEQLEKEKRNEELKLISQYFIKNIIDEYTFLYEPWKFIKKGQKRFDRKYNKLFAKFKKLHENISNSTDQLEIDKLIEEINDLLYKAIKHRIPKEPQGENEYKSEKKTIGKDIKEKDKKEEKKEKEERNMYFTDIETLLKNLKDCLKKNDRIQNYKCFKDFQQEYNKFYQRTTQTKRDIEQSSTGFSQTEAEVFNEVAPFIPSGDCVDYEIPFYNKLKLILPNYESIFKDKPKIEFMCASFGFIKNNLNNGGAIQLKSDLKIDDKVTIIFFGLPSDATKEFIEKIEPLIKKSIFNDYNYIGIVLE